MSQWKKDDRVVLASRPEFVGTCIESERRGSVEVAFDGGGKGRFLSDDLQRVEDAPLTDKTWPPGSLETKALAP